MLVAVGGRAKERMEGRDLNASTKYCLKVSNWEREEQERGADRSTLVFVFIRGR